MRDRKHEKSRVELQFLQHITDHSTRNVVQGSNNA